MSRSLIMKIVLTLFSIISLFILFLAIIWFYLKLEKVKCEVNINNVKNEYDFIIVGAGTAGSVLAHQLSFKSNFSVLLIEAGNVFDPLSIIPLTSTFMQGSYLDWAFKTVPQEHSSKGLFEQQQKMPRGKVLGGTAQLNYMIHFSGNEKDFNNWENLGAHMWSYKNLRKYLLNHNENCGYEETNFFLKDNFCQRHNNDAELEFPITKINRTENKLTNIFLKTAKEIIKNGLNVNFKESVFTIKNGIRWSVYHQYLRPSFVRNNLHILPKTIVHRLLFKKNRISHVLISNDDHKIKVNKELILSAGAIQTPQILKLSGIGNYEELKKLGLPLTHHSKNVGENLFDHLNMPIFISINESISVNTKKILNINEILEYILNGKGVFSNPAVFGIGSAIDFDYGIILFGMGSADEKALRNVANFKPEIFRSTFPLYENQSQDGFILLNTCYQPKSRGSIKLVDKNINTAPLIDPNYLNNEYDIKCMINAIRLSIEIVKSKEFQKIDSKIHWPQISECLPYFSTENELINYPSDEYLECLIRYIALTGHHPGGTCAIGDNPDSVLDNYLNVQGVSGLRVVDGSVFPAPVSGTPNSVIISLALRASDLILKKYSNETH